MRIINPNKFQVVNLARGPVIYPVEAHWKDLDIEFKASVKIHPNFWEDSDSTT
jgi:hypothetical protein